MKRIVLFAIMLMSISVYAQHKKAYQIFTNDGTPIDYTQMAQTLSKFDVVFFGELHNNAIAHWLQFELTKDLHKSNENLILGFEMFESDNQLVIDEYTNQIIPVKKFEADARLWNNYKTDYKPIIDYASENNLKAVASNIPRRYASIVAKKGLEELENLSDDAKKLIAPLPVEYDAELACYKGMLEMMHMPGMKGKVNENLPKAQAIKDATMAYFINQNFKDANIFLHFNGRYHSDNHEGILWYLKKYNEDLKTVTITTVSQKDLDKLADENKEIADFILVVSESMTTTY